ncbi:hypothetical protein [Devosia sp. Root635]|uniref:hypothetical protein n=1 Tax=Devosia sp. Root635 TaxID=1736575 RepID=UPI0006FB03CD|nr:hypothetical protein [Devosia sp. Root635]KRA55325.1 hypothetical protein ASD80_12955 [Devosia sp. Root635]
MTIAVDAAAPCPPTITFRRPALMWWPIFTPRKPRLPPDLSREQLEDAGIPLERAGFGRSADVSRLAITLLESQR